MKKGCWKVRKDKKYAKINTEVWSEIWILKSPQMVILFHTLRHIFH